MAAAHRESSSLVLRARTAFAAFAACAEAASCSNALSCAHAHARANAIFVPAIASGDCNVRLSLNVDGGDGGGGEERLTRVRTRARACGRLDDAVCCEQPTRLLTAAATAAAFSSARASTFLLITRLFSCLSRVVNVCGAVEFGCHREPFFFLDLQA